MTRAGSPWPVGYDHWKLHDQGLTGTHQCLDNKYICNIDMACRCERRRGVSLRNHHCELRTMDLTAVHRHVDENFLLADYIDFDLRRTTFPSNVWASTENGSFFERKLEAA